MTKQGLCHYTFGSSSNTTELKLKDDRMDAREKQIFPSGQCLEKDMQFVVTNYELNCYVYQ